VADLCIKVSGSISPHTRNLEDVVKKKKNCTLCCVVHRITNHQEKLEWKSRLLCKRRTSQALLHISKLNYDLTQAPELEIQHKDLWR
jgi:hypothetical protein